MHIRTDNCHNCNGNQFKDNYVPLEYICQHCEHIDHFTYSANNKEIRELKFGSFLSSFPNMIGAWRDVTKQVVGNGNVFSLNCCSACSKVVLIPRDTLIELECNYCNTPNSFPISDEVMDAFPPGRFQFEMRAGPGAYCNIRTSAEPKISALTESTPCPDCSALIPPFEGYTECASCEKSLFAMSSCGKRVVPGLSVSGHLNGKSIDGWYSLEEFESIHNGVEAAMAKGMDNINIPFRFVGKILRFDFNFNEDEKMFAMLAGGCFLFLTSPFWMFLAGYVLKFVFGLMFGAVYLLAKYIFGVDLKEITGEIAMAVWFDLLSVLF